MTRMLAALLFAVIAAPAFAADTGAKPATPQQQRMKDCNASATSKGLKGAERKQFMSSCLKGETPAAPGVSAKQAAQREKMKTCNADATSKGLKGDERKKFISSCLRH